MGTGASAQSQSAGQSALEAFEGASIDDLSTMLPKLSPEARAKLEQAIEVVAEDEAVAEEEIARVKLEEVVADAVILGLLPEDSAQNVLNNPDPENMLNVWGERVEAKGGHAMALAGAGARGSELETCLASLTPEDLGVKLVLAVLERGMEYGDVGEKAENGKVEIYCKKTRSILGMVHWKQLLERDPKPDFTVKQKGGQQGTALIIAVYSTDFKEKLPLVKALLEAKADVNDVAGYTGHSAMHEWVKSCTRWESGKDWCADPQEIFNALLDARADVNLTNAEKSKKYTPLHLAAECRKVLPARILIEAKADLNSVDLNGRTPLDLAKEQNNECQALLKAAGAKQSVDPVEELHAAVEADEPDVVKKLVDGNADISREHRDSQNSAVEVAACCGSLKAMRVLVEHKADLGGKFSPLMHASKHGRVNVVSWLLEAKADVHGRVNASLHYACEECPADVSVESRGEVVKLLVAAGIDVNTASPLHAAVRLELPSSAVRCLIEAKADLEYKAKSFQFDEDGHAHAHEGVTNRQAIEWLCDKRGDADLRKFLAKETRRAAAVKIQSTHRGKAARRRVKGMRD